MDDRPEGHEYQDYEIPLESRKNLEEIERCLKKELYPDEQRVRDHLDTLENIDTDLTNALGAENRIGRYNATAKHDQNHVRRLMKQLEQKLDEFS